jgi:hypothetical protein
MWKAAAGEAAVFFEVGNTEICREGTEMYGDFTIEGMAVNFELTLIFWQCAIGYNQGLF